MHNPGLHNMFLMRTDSNRGVRMTSAQLIGLGTGICALLCLLLLPPELSIRLLLYGMVVIWCMLRPRISLYLLPFAIAWGSLDALDLGGISLNSADILTFLLAAS